MSNDIDKTEKLLFQRIITILEEARTNTVKAVNSQMVLSYWFIGREIVIEIQSGENRAEYGKKILESLSQELTIKYGKGFSVTNLKNFRSFYSAYPNRLDAIGHPVGSVLEISSPSGSGSTNSIEIKGFSPQLSWSHYRALMRIKDEKARLFYETESIESSWDKRTLERQIHTAYYERVLKSSTPKKIIDSGRKELTNTQNPVETLKNPYVLEFLDLPDSATIHEKEIEDAIITQLQEFLLELGKGFAFVARQKRMQYEDKSLYIDLVFYNCILKCYVLIDLKIGELTHKDVGQMDSYVRMFDDLHTADDDNPTIGLILCAEKNDAVARYSVLKDRNQIFASKYMLYLPSEEELKQELLKEKRLIEAQTKEL